METGKYKRLYSGGKNLRIREIPVQSMPSLRFTTREKKSQEMPYWLMGI